MNYLYGIIGFVLFVALFIAIDHYRMRKIARGRGKSDICKYARSFDYRNVDIKIMREVFCTVQEWAGKYDDFVFPVQSEDSFESLYQMDPDDLDDIYFEVAEKLGISTEDAEQNPYYERVETVKDLVLFLNGQPRLENA